MDNGNYSKNNLKDINLGNYRINSYTEWGLLREVIVGSPISYNAHELDLSFKIFHHDNFCSFVYPLYNKKKKSPFLSEQFSDKKDSINKRYLEELNEDMEELVNALEKEGVKVYRPLALHAPIEFNTPYWKATAIPALNIRDQAIILGDELIETSPQIRARYFENDLLKPIFYRYFNLGSKWSSMPKPIMTDYSFDLSYVKNTGGDIIDIESVYKQVSRSFDVGHEIMFDGAQCMRFGKDVLVNIASKNHELGLRWLKQHLGAKFNFHKVYRLTDNHIDSTILPLRPGTMLLRNPKCLDYLPEALKKWQIIYPPEPIPNTFPDYNENDLILTSKYIDLNVLSIDENRVIVNSLCPDLIKILEKNKFTPIPVRHRHRRIFGGGFHCFTLDTVRVGEAESYF